jgi:error-prone DNA polymerase
LTLEDEEGIINVVIRPVVYERYRQVFRLEPVILVEGIIQKRDGVTNLIAEKMAPFRQQEKRQRLFYLKPSWLGLK